MGLFGLHLQPHTSQDPGYTLSAQAPAYMPLCRHDPAIAIGESWIVSAAISVVSAASRSGPSVAPFENQLINFQIKDCARQAIVLCFMLFQALDLNAL